MSALEWISTIGNVLAPILGFGSGMGTNYYNLQQTRETNETNRANTMLNNQTQIDLANQQHAWNIEDWQRQNEYDSPAAQMQRFREAGLNPSLIYGQMSQSSPIQGTTLPHTEAARALNHQATDPMQSALLSAQTELAEASADKARADAAESESRIPINEQRVKEVQASAKRLEADAESIGLANQFSAATMADRIATAAKTASAERANAELSENQAKEAMKYVSGRLKADYNMLLANAEKARNEKLISAEQLKIVQEEVKKAQHETSLAEYNDRMKEWVFWINVADKGLSHVENIIGLFKNWGVTIQKPAAPSARVQGLRQPVNDFDVPDVFN